MSVYRAPAEVDTDEIDIDDAYAQEAWQTRRVMLATVQTLCMQAADGTRAPDVVASLVGCAIDLFNCAEGSDNGQ